MVKYGWFAAVGLALSLPLEALADDVKYRDDQVPGTQAQIDRGKVMFGACSGCHGAQGEGLVGFAPRINSGPYLAIISDEFIRTTLKNGRPGTPMIAWGAAMSDEDLTAVVAYVRSWQTEDGIPLDESPLKGSAKKGEELFGQNCEPCHGTFGGGYAEDGMGIGIGYEGFLNVASNGMIRAIVTKGKTGTPMKSFVEDGMAPFGALSAKDIDSIILYLRENAR